MRPVKQPNTTDQPEPVALTESALWAQMTGQTPLIDTVARWAAIERRIEALETQYFGKIQRPDGTGPGKPTVQS